jgi:hypothetical protein
MHCRIDQKYRMLYKQHCDDYPFCDGYHRRDEYNKFIVCLNCLKKHPYDEYDDRGARKPKCMVM